MRYVIILIGIIGLLFMSGCLAECYTANDYIIIIDDKELVCDYIHSDIFYNCDDGYNYKLKDVNKFKSYGHEICSENKTLGGNENG